MNDTNEDRDVPLDPGARGGDTKPDLDALQALAELVGSPRNFPAPWTVREPTDDEFESVGIAAIVESGDDGDVTDWTDVDLARYFAAVAPDRMLDYVAYARTLEADNERLRGWKSGAMEVMRGLEDIGRALDLPLGERITGPAALERIKDMTAKTEALQRGAKTLGRILDDTLKMALDASGRHDVIDDDGDGDWEIVWETLASLRPRAEAAEAERDRLAHRLDQLRTAIEQSQMFPSHRDDLLRVLDGDQRTETP